MQLVAGAYESVVWSGRVWGGSAGARHARYNLAVLAVAAVAAPVAKRSRARESN